LDKPNDTVINFCYAAYGYVRSQYKCHTKYKQPPRSKLRGILSIKTKRTVGASVVAGCVAEGLITVVVVSSPPVAYLDDEEWSIVG